eukprot:9007651-Lingulodinium_polyedra.AAC.1
MFRRRSGLQSARLRAPCAGQFSVRAWNARACDLRAVATLRDDAVEPTFRRRSGSQIARSRAPCAGQFS